MFKMIGTGGKFKVDLEGKDFKSVVPELLENLKDDWCLGVESQDGETVIRFYDAGCSSDKEIFRDILSGNRTKKAALLKAIAEKEAELDKLKELL